MSLLKKSVRRKILGSTFTILLLANFIFLSLNMGSVFASPGLSLKWTRSLGSNAQTYIGPLAADINGDGKLEIIVTGGSSDDPTYHGTGTVTALNGATGNVVWQVTVGGVTRHTPFEIADINNDGLLEIIVSGSYPTVLHGSNGAIYWQNTAVCSYNLYSPVADIDGDGYYEIFCSSGRAPWIGDDYFWMLSYDGKILRQNNESWHPCWGGLTIGDANFDGIFELYQGDRRYGYDTSTPYTYGEHGVSCLDPYTLTRIWEDNDITCSSHTPMLADVDKDGILDVIVTHQSTGSGGLAVYNALTGSVLTTGGKNRKILSGYSASHSQPTIADVDFDGNLEIIACRNTQPKIWDLYDWKLDAILPVVCIEPPKVGDVTGDGKLDIIAATGSEIYIYSYDEISKTYVQVDYLAVSCNAFTLVQDVDGDGYNELITTSGGGTVRCFDTTAPAPTPRVRSNVQFYSERHLGAAEYVPPPGPQAPIVTDPTPTDGEIDVPVALSQLSFKLTDFQRDLMSYTVTTSPNIGSGSGTNVGNGRYSVAISGLEYGKTYTWYVDVTDGVNWAHKIFTFTTKSLPPWWDTRWQYRKTITIDQSQVSGDQTNFPVLIDMVDSDLKGKAQLDGDDILFADENNVKLSHEIEQYDGSTGHLVAWVSLPFVSSTSFTTFYMYYGNPTASNQEDPAAVWDTSYKLVLHLSEEHECRMWAMISDSGLPHDIVLGHLITDTSSLEALSSGNLDGWGLAWYVGTDFEERRGEPPAYTDPNYQPAANELAGSGATIGVAHVRSASAGTPTNIPDPHPFTRIKNSKTWALAHNGYISKPTLKTLINARDPNYLSENPPNVGDWNVENSYVDSDLYMAYVMLCIEQSNWDVLTGLAIVANTVPSGIGNIILTDGTTIWAFANGQTLTYYYQSTSPTYSVVASQKPDPAQTGWTSMSAYNLVILTKNNAPIFISDIRQFKLLVDATFDASADSTALRADGTGQDWYESRNVPPSTLLYLDTANVAGNTGKKAGFTASSSGNAYLTQEFGVPQTGTFSVQWDIYVDSILDISQTDRAAWMMIGDNYDTSTTNYLTPNNPPAERFVYMAFYKNNGGTTGTMDLVAKTIAGDFNAHTVIASDLNLKQWYTIKVIVDVAAKSYDVYVDDVFMTTFVSDFARNSVTHISFAQWDDGAGAFYVDNVYAPAPISMHTLNVNVVGSGIVTKNPDTPTYAYGTSVTLTATASPGWSFSGWSGDYEGSANPATIMMDSDKEITATFVTEVYTLSVNVVGSGSVTKSPDSPTYNYGDEVTLTANPNAGYKFVAWSGDLSGTANPAVVTMTGNKAVTATFVTEDTPVCVDSSSYGHIGVLHGDVTQGAVGVIDGAYAFDGVNDYVRFEHSSALTGYTTSFTASFWLRLDDVTKRQAILNKYETSGSQRGWYIEFQTHSTYGKVLGFFASQNGASYREWYASFSPTAGTWYYITLVWQSNTVPKFYVNGVQVATINTGTIASIYNNAGAPLYVGRSYTTGRYLKGSLDEIRLCSPAKSASYILTSYNNQKNPSLFCQVGPEQSLPTTPIISNPDPANGAINVPISLSKLSFNLVDYQNDVMDYTVTTNPDIGSATVIGATSGTHSISVSGLQYGTTYTWEVSVTDGTHSTTSTYAFTTALYIQQFLVDSTFDASANSADLRVNAAEQDWYESRNDIPTILYLDESNVGGNIGKKAGFLENSADNAYVSQEFSPAQTEVFTAEWDIYIDTIVAGSDNGYKAGIMLIGDETISTRPGPNSDVGERFVYMAFYKAGGGTTGTMDLIVISPRTTVATGLNLDQWYNIKVVVDLTTDTYAIYVDGAYKATVNANAAKTSVTHISFAQWDDGAGAFYVDNVYAYVEIEDVWTITASAGLGGNIDPSGVVTVIDGADQDFTITPSAGYQIADVLVDGASVGAVPTYTFEDVTADHTIVASFSLLPSLLVDSTFDASVDSADLRTNGAGQDWYESRADGTNGPLLLYLDENNIGGNSGKKAGFTESTSYNAYVSQEFSVAQTGTFAVQWDIYVDSISAAYQMAGFMFVGDNTVATRPGPNSDPAERFVRMCFYKAGGGDTGTMTLIGASTSTIIAEDLYLDQWYTIKVVLDLTTDTYDVYVDGVLKRAGIGAATAKTSVTHVSFAQWNDGAGAFYVDNVFSPALDRYKLAVSVEGSGSVDVTPGESSYAAGAVVTLTATADLGYAFSDWSGDVVSTDNPVQVTMDGDKTVTATFAEVPIEYSLTVNIEGNGVVNKVPDQAMYVSGSVVELSALADPGWVFSGWSGDLSGNTNPTVIEMTSDKTITATFTQEQYTLTVDVEGGGSVTKTPDQPTYTYGTVVELTATPEPGYAFSHWTGDLSGDLNPESVSMTENKAVTAVFVWTQTNWWDAAWQYRRTITIDHTKVSGDQTDFPVLIDLTDSGLTLKAQTDGDDFVFTDADQVKLSHEIELYESSAGHLVAWVKIPLLSSTTDTALYMYYGNPSSANQEDVAAVWDASNKLVLHLDETTGIHYDSTVNGNNGTPYNGVIQGVSGKIDGADTFDGLNDYVQVAHSSELTGYTTSFTASFWLKLEDVSRRQAILNKYDTAGGQRGWYIEYNPVDSWRVTCPFGLFASSNGNTYSEWWANFVPAADTWYYVTIVWEANAVPKFYVNGVQVATINTGTIASIYNNAGAPLYIGRSYTTGRHLKGSLDEIRISNPVRSASWILTCYNSQSNPSTFYEIGTEEHYETPRYTLTINLVGQGSVTKDPDQITYIQDTIVQLTATADPGWTFTSWSGDVITTDNPTTITMDSNKVVTATFSQITWTITASAGEGGSIDPVGDVVVAEGSDQLFTITADTGYEIADVLVDGESVGAVTEYTFLAVSADHTIVASFKLKTWTITASAGVGGSIDPSGAVVVADGADQAFTITPNTGFQVLDVLVDGSSVGPVTEYTFTAVSADHTIEASFELIPVTWTITASAGVGGSISPSGAVTVADGADQSFTITPDSGYQVADVLVDGLSQGAITGYTFYAVDADHTIEASFELIPLLVDSTFDASVDSDDLRANAAEQDWYESRAQVPTLLYLDETNVDGNAGKKAGFTASESGNAYCTQEFSSTQTGTFTVQWDIYVDSIFAGSRSKYRAGQMMLGADLDASGGPNRNDNERFVFLAFYKSGGGTEGTADLVAMLDFDTQVTIASGLNLDQWYTIKVIVDVATDTYDVYVDGVFKMTVDACTPLESVSHISFAQWDDGAGAFYVDNVFSPAVDRCKLSVDVEGSGTVAVVPGESSYAVGAEVTLTADPADGWVFSGWSGDASGTELTTSVTMDADKSVTATFTQITHTITASAGTGGSINPSGIVVVADGADQSFTITPDSGYQVLDVLVDGESVGAVTEYTFTAVDADHTIEASFELVPITWTIVASAGPGGTIDPVGDVLVADGADQSFTITPDPGYKIADVLVDGLSVGPASEYTFLAVSEDHTISASFAALSTYTIVASAGVGGDISPSGDVTVFEGSDQLFTIAAHSGYQIADVLVDGASVGAVPTYTFEDVSADHTIAASFSLLPPLLVDSTFDASVDSADLYSNGAGQDWYDSRNQAPTLLYLDESDVGGNAGKKAGFTASTSGNVYLSQEFASPQTGTFTVQWHIYVDSITNIGGTDATAFMMIGDDSTPTSPGPNYPTAERFVYMAFYKNGGGTDGTMELFCRQRGTDTRTLIATLNLDQWYTIRVDVDVAGGDYDVYIDGSFMGTYTSRNAKTSVTHISFAQWNDGAGAFYVDNVYAPAMDTFTIVASAGAGGSIDPSGNVVVAEGSDQLFTITPETGYQVLDVLVDGVSVGAVSTYTFEDVASDHTIAASFELVPVTWTITASAGPGGSIDPSGDVVVADGADQTFTITADTGYEIADVLVDGVSVGAVSEYTFYAVSEDHTITASFRFLSP